MQDCDVQMTVEFHDRYVSNGFWFKERVTNRDFCYSAGGDENTGCLKNFTGSIAIARYRVQPRARRTKSLSIRENVRTIDQDSRLVSRPPFQRAIQLEHGLATDIQAFGYQLSDGTELAPPPKASDPWCLLRQDLHLEGEQQPFLVVHWKHTFPAIRLIDVIPGEQTIAL